MSSPIRIDEFSVPRGAVDILRRFQLVTIGFTRFQTAPAAGEYGIVVRATDEAGVIVGATREGGIIVMDDGTGRSGSGG